ncbi:MAG: hypothetical protein R3Y54_10665 [Eubacteriales bacterium]
MKRDLKINFGVIITIAEETKQYYDALVEIERALLHIDTILNENKAESIGEIIIDAKKLEENIISCKQELLDVHELFGQYFWDMTGIIRPIEQNQIMRVDSNDIYWNKNSINNACEQIGNIPMNIIDDGPEYEWGADNEPINEIAERNRKNASNYDKLIEINSILHAEVEGFELLIDRMNQLYQKSVEFEECDDYYKRQASELNDKYATAYEKIGNVFTGIGNGLTDIGRGAKDAIAGTIEGMKSLAEVMWVGYVGKEVMTGYGMMGLEKQTPDWAINAVESNTMMFKGFLEMLKDPKAIIRGSIQEVSDTIEEEGICYAIGVVVPEIAELFIAKGASKVKTKLVGLLDTISDTANGVKIIDNLDDMIDSSHIKGFKGTGIVVNNADEFYEYVSNIGKRTDLSNEQKLKIIHATYDTLGDAKGDVTVIADVKYLKSEGFNSDGRPIVDWPKHMGFEYDSVTSITKENPLPDKWDRVGGMGGDNFTTLPDHKDMYTFEERAIPYLDNSSARHVGTFQNADYFDVIDAIKEKDLYKLNEIMERNQLDTFTHTELEKFNNNYNDFIDRVQVEVGDIDATYGLKGKAAPWEVNGEVYLSGGADQVVTPFSGNDLQKLGLLTKEF